MITKGCEEMGKGKDCKLISDECFLDFDSSDGCKL